MIYVEDLQVANMSKSAKGTAEVHGKNVKQKFQKISAFIEKFKGVGGKI
nr:hypothetical protein [Pasteurella multocida]